MSYSNWNYTEKRNYQQDPLNISGSESYLNVTTKKDAPSYTNNRESPEIAPSTRQSTERDRSQIGGSPNRDMMNFDYPRVTVFESFSSQKTESNEAISQIEQLRIKIDSLKRNLAKKDEEAKQLKAQIEAVLNEPKQSFLEKTESIKVDVNEVKKELDKQQLKIADLQLAKNSLQYENIAVKSIAEPTKEDATKLKTSLNNLSALVDSAKNKVITSSTSFSKAKDQSKPTRNWLKQLIQGLLYLFIFSLIILMYVDLPIYHQNNNLSRVASNRGFPNRNLSNPRLLNKTRNGKRIDL